MGLHCKIVSDPQTKSKLTIQMIPAIINWLTFTEERILANGRWLSQDESKIADAIGVKYPVRVLAVEHIKLPPDIARLCSSFGMNEVAGFTADHGILVAREGRDLVAHELTHVAQRERYSSLTDFVTEYLQQCMAVGYIDAPFEVEARKIQAQYA